MQKNVKLVVKCKKCQIRLSQWLKNVKKDGQMQKMSN